MHDVRSPQFETNPLLPDTPPDTAAIWRMKVTDTAPGGNEKLLTCVLLSPAGTKATRTYNVLQTGVHGVDDEILVCRPLGGTSEKFNDRPVTLAECAPLGNLFPVALKQNGGGDGDGGSPPTYLYDLYSVNDNTKKLNNGAAQRPAWLLNNPTNGSFLPANLGTAYMGKNGIVLFEANEAEDTGSCASGSGA